MTGEHDEYEAALAADPETRAADEFNRTFEPLEGVEYAWVVAYAKETFEDSRKRFERLDAKATTLITYLSGVTGAIAISSIAGLSTAKLPLLVVVAALPSLLLAIASLIFAFLARRPMPVFAPTPIPKAVAVAQHYKKGDVAEAAFLSQWHLLTVLMRPTIDAKSAALGWSHFFIPWMAALLALPFISSMLVSGEAPKPLQVEIRKEK